MPAGRLCAYGLLIYSKHMENNIVIFTDGSSRGNPGPGGWGAVVIAPDGKVTELGGREAHTTNNRMEIAAALGALGFVEARKLVGDVVIHTDSAYLLNGVTGWMYGWEKNGWKTKTGEPVLNQDLWRELGAVVFRLKQKNVLDWKKVSGHTGHRGNERADVIATNAADQAQQILFIGNLSDYERMIGGSVYSGTDEALVEKKKGKKSGPAYSYVSAVGGIVMTHKTWAECEARVKGKRGVKFQKVFSSTEETDLISRWKQSNEHES